MITPLLLLACPLPAPPPAQEPGPTVTPDDPFFVEQVGFRASEGPAQLLRRSNAAARLPVDVAPGVGLDVERAWALTTGSRAVVVAVLDDGFFYRHEDVAPNLWRNPGETGRDAAGVPRAVNGRDDDGNGYVDDVLGWDFAFEDPDPDPYVFDGMDRSRIQPYWHSIGALGIIGAAGHNGVGVAGINWDVSLMLLKIGAQGVGRDEPDPDRVVRAARALRYAVDNGARVVNWSGFVRPRDPAVLAPLEQALTHADEHGVLVVVAAGNDGLDLDDPANAVYPECFDHGCLLRVAQVAYDGELYSYVVGGQLRGSNHGPGKVEIAALGQNFTTGLQHGEPIYWLGDGTSNAAPVVAGVAALVLSVRPDLDARALEEVLLESATPLAGLRGRVRCGGVVNAQRAVRAALARR